MRRQLRVSSCLVYGSCGHDIGRPITDSSPRRSSNEATWPALSMGRTSPSRCYLRGVVQSLLVPFNVRVFAWKGAERFWRPVLGRMSSSEGLFRSRRTSVLRSESMITDVEVALSRVLIPEKKDRSGRRGCSYQRLCSLRPPS